MAEKKLTDLFYDTLKDIYFAERQILKSLPKMANAAHSDDLKTAFLAHRDETEGQIERLQQIFEIFGKRAQAKTCEAIRGILEEGEEIIENYKDSAALDAGLCSQTSRRVLRNIALRNSENLGNSAWAERRRYTARPKSAGRKENGCTSQQVGRTVDQR